MLGTPAISLKQRLFTGDTLVLASHNRGKLKELQALVEPYGIKVLGAGDLGLIEPVEDGLTYAENAMLKARAAASASGLPALADDSGLGANALGGAPGVHSARWAEKMPGGRDFAWGMEKLWVAIAASKDKRAQFTCALALAYPDHRPGEMHVGILSGTLTWPPRGTAGFGYDPMFVPDGFTQTLAELGSVVKDQISHRAQAFAVLAAVCFKRA
ncbi:MAG: non-canonical purine NTP pyrophosphatase [Holosporales bacterium]|jgi:XTP/dITP diphosphohydrolase